MIGSKKSAFFLGDGGGERGGELEESGRSTNTRNFIKFHIDNSLTIFDEIASKCSQMKKADSR